MEDDAGEQRVDESHEAIDVGTFTIAARDQEVNNLWQFGPGTSTRDDYSRERNPEADCATIGRAMNDTNRVIVAWALIALACSSGWYLDRRLPTPVAEVRPATLPHRRSPESSES